MEKKYIKDRIGEEYVNWNPGDSIFLSTPTGSGKTTFILKTLLPYYAEKGQKLLYLVNRKALKQQLEKELRDYDPRLRLCIDIELYQTLENRINSLNKGDHSTDYYQGYCEANNLTGNYLQNQYAFGNRFKTYGYYANDMNQLMSFFYGYSVVICDECHYFCTDSTFNTNTILSYQFIQRAFRNKVKLFMSATIEEIKAKIEQDFSWREYDRTRIYDFVIPKLPANDFLYVKNYKCYPYTLEKNYDHINVEVISHTDLIPALVTKGNYKWLIFVDNKETGRTIKKRVNEICNDKKKKKTVEFVTSDYRYDEDAIKEMDSIVSENRQNADILIATSVLDNGINLHDGDLRNVIVMADTETEFIQMLGRRRDDGLPVTVYLYKYNQEYFRKRYMLCSRRYEFAYEYYKHMEKVVNEIQGKMFGSFSNWLPEINDLERNLVKSEHKLLLQQLMRNQMHFDDLKTCFYEFDGELRLNTLSMNHLWHQKQFYKEMVKAFDTDEEGAFYKKQLEWLGKSESCLAAAQKSSIDRAKETFVNSLEELMDKNEKTNQKEDWYENRGTLTKKMLSDWKHQYKNVIREVFTQCKHLENYENIRLDLGKKGRPFTGPQMELFQQHCGIPYKLESNDEKPGIYQLSRIDDMNSGKPDKIVKNNPEDN